MPRSYKTGLGVALLSTVVAVTPLVPVAGSSPSPKWVWDSDGKVRDEAGIYRSLTDEEACELYGFCRRPLPSYPNPERGGDEGGGGSC